MVKFGLTGGVLGHSMSAVIHNKLFEVKNREGEYKLYETSDLDKNFKNELSALDAFNITIPYKKDIMKHLHYIDKTAEMYNACNFVVNKNGRYSGYNTDVDGFLYTLKSNNVELKGKKVLLTGAGGVSHMLAATAAAEGAEVTVLARNSVKAEALCAFVEEKTGNKLNIYDGGEFFDVLLQGTPAGMYPNYFDAPVPLEMLKNIPFVFDTIYNPIKTLTVAVSEYYENKAASGLTMLVSQAAKAQEMYFGCEFQKEDIIAAGEECIPFIHKTCPDFNIILIGAPGCGKTTLAKELSVLIGAEVCDLDSEIEREEKRTINEIFSADGEDYFRKKETDVLLKALEKNGRIISTGGGIVERNDIQSLKNEKDIVIYINTPVEILKGRVKNDISRPLLSENAVEKLVMLLNRREKLYKSSADIEIMTVNNIKDDAVSVLDEIIKYIKKN